MRFGSRGRALPPGADLPDCDRVDREGMVYAQRDGAGVKYFQDRKRQYPFDGGLDALALLKGLLTANDVIMPISKKRMEDSGNAAELLKEGEKLYAEKPTMKRHHGAKGTWSDAEYAHPGLQHEYLRLKSFQRFTESWALLERAAMYGIFDDLLLPPDAPEATDKESKVVCGLGGGPGYELLAFDWFMRYWAHARRKGGAGEAAEVRSRAGRQAWLAAQTFAIDGTTGEKAEPNANPSPSPNGEGEGGEGKQGAAEVGEEYRVAPLDFISVDLQPTWEPFVSALGYRFAQYDLHGERKPTEAAGRERLDICIISNVLNYCTDEDSAELLTNLLRNGTRAILLNERGAEQRMVELVQKRGVRVVRLLCQEGCGRDDRQMIFFPPAENPSPNANAPPPPPHAADAPSPEANPDRNPKPDANPNVGAPLPPPPPPPPHPGVTYTQQDAMAHADLVFPNVPYEERKFQR